MQKRFFLILAGICFLGLFLRLQHYGSVPPFSETKDEFIYPWAGMSLLQTGTPVSWSPFQSYPVKYTLTAFGESYPLVKPYIEKPFLYPLITGAWMLIHGVTQFNQVRFELLRLVPIFLSIITIVGIGLLTRKIADAPTALVTSLLYAITPQIILANRLSLTENLLTPLIVFGLWLGIRSRNSFTNWSVHLAALTAGLAIITKQTGFTLPLTLFILFLSQKQYRAATIIGIYGTFFALMHPLIAYYYDWTTYVNVSLELKNAHALGFPEAIFTLLRFPGIGHKESIFLDGTMLAGWLLLLSAPARISALTKQFLWVVLFPVVYLLFVVLGEGGTTWYGWHMFPLYPFLILLLAQGFVFVYETYNLLPLFFYFITIGSSLLRFLLQLFPVYKNHWQSYMFFLLVLLVIPFAVKNQKFVRWWTNGLFVGYTILTIYIALHLPQLYPSLAQPQ